MTTAEIEARPPQAQTSVTLPAKVQYAKCLADSGLLPAQYRRQPANVLWAMEYGDMLGLSAMAAITGVHVIEGKPTASAGLISALVRRAGHKLRVRGDGKQAICQIIRADDPGYTFEVTWTLRRNNDGHPSAEEAGLLNKDVWKKYPASMLKSRVITQCARDACEEALFGLHYTPEELGADVDEEGNLLGEPAQPANGATQAPAGSSPDGPGAEDDPWIVRDAGAADPEWESVTSSVSTFSTNDDGQKLWAAVLARRNQNKITSAEAEQLKETIRDRWKELKDAAPVAGTVVPGLDPEDSWTAAVEAIQTADDAVALASEVAKAMEQGGIDDDKGAALIAAISAREAAISGQGAAA